MSPADRRDPITRRHITIRLWSLALPAVLALLLITSCYEQKMAVRGKLRPYGASSVFPDGRVARPLVAGTVPRRALQTNSPFASGLVNGTPATAFPFAVTAAVLSRGRERFEIACAPCHGRLGDGQGMIVERGFQAPPTFHQDRLRQAPPGHFVNVIDQGFGAMYPYAARVVPSDRWAIAAYVRALQLSQDAPLSAIPAAERDRLAGMAP